MKKILIGCDPEVFWKNKDHVVSVIGKLGGNKLEARKVTEEILVLEDNVAAEFNPPPCDSAEKFIEVIDKNLQFLEEEANKFGASLARNLSSISFPISELTHPAAFVFGCEPDFDAWRDGLVNASPTSEDPFLRSAGGHVHIGGVSDMDLPNLIRCADIFLGLPSLFLDGDKRRRELYGKPGCFRPKPYGVEYRTLSNFWIFDSELRRFVFNQSHKAVEFARNNKIESNSEVGHQIQQAINEYNLDMAQDLCDRFKVYA